MSTSTMIQYYGTGKRKYAIARIYLRPGKGTITVNDKALNEYFPTEILRMMVRQPLQLTDTENKFDILINVCGGGMSGQAGAARHGIAKALVAYNKELRIRLKRNGFLTRDSRVKERKKYGQRGARARYQFSKR
jgi:small subunit ribosomal protein S9